MKYRTNKPTLVLFAMFGLALVNASSQAPAQDAPRLATPVVIPSATSNSIFNASQPATIQAQSNLVQQQPKTSGVPQAQSLQDNTFGELSLPVGASQTVSRKNDKAQVPVKSAKTERDAEMVVRMKMAVEQIAAEYGNPRFAQVFTNDPIQAQILRKRVQMLQRVEAINAEIAALQKQKADAQSELDSTRRELLALQEQSQALLNRLQKARFALDGLK